MLSSFLPGQEAGNVPFVTDSGFGEYSRDPDEIAKRVSGWIQDPVKLEEMSANARAAGTPLATKAIAEELCEILNSYASDAHVGVRPAAPVPTASVRVAA